MNSSLIKFENMCKARPVGLKQTSLPCIGLRGVPCSLNRVLTEADIARQAGLDKDSIVKAEIIITVPKSSIVKKIGSFPGEAMVHIDECLKISLAL